MDLSFVHLYLWISIYVSLPCVTALQIPLRSHNEGDQLGAVASENKICSQIGIDVLNGGGNAADALVATVFCVGVLDCHHSGIGGGSFALARSSNGSYESIDFRETAPAAASEEMFEHNVLESLFGGLASATPSEVRGLQYLHSRYGNLPWSRLILPAIGLARNGFVVSEDFAKAMDLSTRSYDFLSKDPVWALDFAPNGTRVGQGDVMTRKRYAVTLQAIADNGVDAFYKGPIAEALIRRVQETNGTMTLQDLKRYDVVSRKPVDIAYKGKYRLYACGAPASGSVCLSALKILEGYAPPNSDPDLYIHRIDEAMRFGYGKRASFGDPDHVEGLHQFEQEMLGEEFAVATRAKISDTHTLNVSAYDPKGFESHEDHGTSHIVTADASGMAFSLTSTINLFFGSRVMVPESGIILNDQMNDFSIPNISNVFGYYPSPANYARPLKRPLSSMAPMMAEFENGTLFAVFGASGGSRIITTNIQNALHILDANMSIQDTLASPRMHDQLIPNRVTFETSYDNDTVESMKARGHVVTWGSAGSSAQALRISNGRFEAGGEPRQKDSAGLTT